MRWRETQMLASADLGRDTVSLLMSSPAETSSNSAQESQTNDTEVIEYPTEALDSSGGSSASTPQPSSKQALAHVLIVDDNEINVKVPSTLKYHIHYECL